MIDDNIAIELWCKLAFKVDLTKEELRLLDNVAGLILKSLEK